ncbi:MAG TPA: aldo/keto reductase [Polyangiaceae bacterium]|nr:aldo/keto reductase [Polyangiaceae bacterium]
MEYVNLGKTGLKVSRICLGTMTFGSPEWRNWVLGESESLPFIARALERGINFFDTADVYSLGQSEVVLGNCLQKLGVRRDQVVIATKVHSPMGEDPNQRGQSRKHIRHAIDDSLRRLKVDYVDLYQIHRFDPHTPLEESLDALDGLVRAGKVLYLGASSMYAWQFAKLLHTADRLGLRRFVSMQNHYNLVYREEEREMNPLCEAEGIGLIPWSPLARGFLTKNRPQGSDGATVRGKNDAFAQSMYKADADYTVVDRVSAIAAERGVSNAEVALAWLLSRPAVSAPIVGATQLEHIDAAARATELVLSREERAALEAPYIPHPVLGHG